MENANTFLTNLNQVFDEKTKTSLKGSITELNSMLASFNKISKTLDVLITNNEAKLDSTLTNFKTASANLASVTDEIAKANLSDTIKDLQSTLSSVKGLMQSIDKGEGSMGKLMKDDALYNNLEGATKELEELLRDIKLHPKRYFRILSKKEIPYKKD